MGSLRLFTAGAIVLAVLTVMVLPLPLGTRLFLLAVGVFCAVFIAVDAGGRGRIFASLVTVALSLYLALTAQRGVLLMQSAGPVGVALGLALIVLPVLGAWAMVREIIFGARTQQLASLMAAEGKLPEDNLPRTDSGRIERAAADAQFSDYAQAVEDNPQDWSNWFNLSLAYDAAGDRKRARKAMRAAISLHRGGSPASISV